MADARLLQARLTERGKLGEALHYEVGIADFLNTSVNPCMLLFVQPKSNLFLFPGRRPEQETQLDEDAAG